MHLPNTTNALQVSTFPTFGFFQHSEIDNMINHAISADRMYLFIDISPCGNEFSREMSGRDIRREYAGMFGNYLHAFFVYEKWSQTPVFVYAWPIPGRVERILSTRIQ